MNNDLTISTLTYKLSYSDKTGSLRTEVSRGINLPETMQVKHQKFTDSLTGLPGSQSALIIEYHKALADGRIAPVARATLKVQSLQDANVTSADVLAVIERIVNIIQEDDTGLDLADEIFVSKEQ
jgi:hypothetical protein